MVANSILATVLSDNNVGKVVRTHVPVSPSSINWYRCKSQGVNDSLWDRCSLLSIMSGRANCWLKTMETDMSTALRHSEASYSRCVQLC